MTTATRSAVDVSVVMAVRNGVRFIDQALDSLEASTVTPREVLVIDGRSEDGTAEVVRRRSWTTLVAQQSSGIADAYNEAIAQTRGGLIAFLSHDDLWAPHKLARHVDVMTARPDLALTVSLVQHFLEPGAVAPSGFRRELLDEPVPGMLMEALVARRDVFEAVGPFDNRFATGEDTDWFARARDLGVAQTVIPEVLVRKRVHAANASLNDSQTNTNLLTALRRSVERKRAAP
ncbi:MAG TPA: glycosyltransferase [Caulobacteraceae bacterium]|jgi:glycosyltransferase involved in cell wall biosynthesis|nr:glycosyltransferase [Caulobacteraceae bacterium]